MLPTIRERPLQRPSKAQLARQPEQEVQLEAEGVDLGRLPTAAQFQIVDRLQKVKDRSGLRSPQRLPHPNKAQVLQNRRLVQILLEGHRHL